MTEKDAIVWLWEVPGMRLIYVNKLKHFYDCVRNVWQSNAKELAGIIPEKVVKGIGESRGKIPHWEKIYERHGIRTLVFDGESEQYPINLATISQPPPILYCRGEFKPEDQKAIAIVGTRKASPYGLAMAEKLSSHLVRDGVTVVSGLALGIDGAAHRAALAAGGRTIGVLGSAVHSITPARHRELALKVLENGALVSVTPTSQAITRGHFVVRNRVIAGLSLGVVVIEGSQTSGALHTARFCKRMGRPVFAVPGQATQENASGPNRLLKEGAFAVTDVSDIYTRLGWKKPAKRPPLDQGVAEVSPIVAALKQGEKSMTELAEGTGMPITQLMTEVTRLELNGVILVSGDTIYLQEISSHG